MKVVTARIEDTYIEDLKAIERDEHTDRAEIVRKLIAIGIQDWKIKRALELIKERKLTIRKAASFARVSYVEMVDLVSKEGIDIGYTLKDLMEDSEE